jgi:hypothetical protein
LNSGYFWLRFSLRSSTLIYLSKKWSRRKRKKEEEEEKEEQ